MLLVTMSAAEGCASCFFFLGSDWSEEPRLRRFRGFGDAGEFGVACLGSGDMVMTALMDCLRFLVGESEFRCCAGGSWCCGCCRILVLGSGLRLGGMGALAGGP